jgi:release factor glutamine methyltransferase
MPTLAELIREAQRALAGIKAPELDGRLLVQHFTGTSRTDALARPDEEVSQEAIAAVRAALARRIAGEPVHRIFGHREFYGLDLVLSPATLEPRPDTEILVDRLLPHLRKIMRAHRECRILDLGTGTGAIALALLSQVTGPVAVGVDIDAQAVSTARLNAERNGLAGRFTGVVSDWFAGIGGKFHAIVSNPPYIEKAELESLPREVRLFDPERALDGGLDGLDAYREIADGAAGHLEPEGIVGVEIGHRQRESVIRIFEASGFRLIEAARDLGGRDRVLLFRMRPKVTA